MTNGTVNSGRLKKMAIEYIKYRCDECGKITQSGCSDGGVHDFCSKECRMVYREKLYQQDIIDAIKYHEDQIVHLREKLNGN